MGILECLFLRLLERHGEMLFVFLRRGAAGLVVYTLLLQGPTNSARGLTGVRRMYGLRPVMKGTAGQSFVDPADLGLVFGSLRVGLAN